MASGTLTIWGAYTSSFGMHARFQGLTLIFLKVTGLPAQVSEGSHGQVVRPGYYAVRVTIVGLPKRTRYVLRGHSSHEFNESFTFMGQMLREVKDPDVTVEVFRRGADNAEIAVSSATLPLESFKDKRKDTHRAIELPGGVTVHCAVKWSGLKDAGHSLMFATCTISRSSAAAAAASALGDAKTERAGLGGSKEAEEEPQEDEHADEYKDDDDDEEDEEDEEELRRWREEDDADLKRAKPSALQVLLRAMDGEDDDDERRSPRRQRRLTAESAASTDTAQMELRLAEDRVRQLETRLLDAEETICHLKAEKLDAWRRIERLSRQRSASSDTDADASTDLSTLKIHNRVHELQAQLAELTTQHAVELEERMAVIREQEREVLDWKRQLEEAHEQIADLAARNEELQRRLALATTASARTEESIAVLEEAPLSSASSTDFEWREELVRHPTPPFDLDSPEVQYILFSWTPNLRKVQYLRSWLTQVAASSNQALPAEFPLGVELPRLPPEIRDGFLTLVVPLLRQQTHREIHVHTRQYNDQFHTDLRVRAVPR
ncbi:hypothetical protein ATCC90586_005030 [Pythium insidiosum]|nr:hypothetical protein ATCC90586_005030 [Pythium insidiosum]